VATALSIACIADAMHEQILSEIKTVLSTPLERLADTTIIIIKLVINTI
jgi:hypothetical protein